MKEKFFCEKLKYYFQSQIEIKTLIEDSQAQVKTIRPSEKWSMLFLPQNLILILFGHHIDSPGSGSAFPKLVRIQGSHINTDPHGSGSETLDFFLIKIPLLKSFRIRILGRDLPFTSRTS